MYMSKLKQYFQFWYF